MRPRQYIDDPREPLFRRLWHPPVIVADLVAKLKALPQLAEIQAIERVVRDDDAEITVMILTTKRRLDGSVGQEQMHASLGGFNGVWR